MASLYNSDSDDDVLEAAVVAMLVDFNHGKADRSCWVRPWIARRSDLGAYKALMRELEAEDTKRFVNFLRMDRESFDQLLGRVSPMITKADTPMRDSIPPGEKLAITLRYLATGDSYKSLEFLYRVPKNTICNFVPQVCVAIYETLKKDFLKVPQSEEEWLQVAEGFEEKWQFPHCIGALDGKHISIKSPAKSGSLYYNYKNFFSIVLLALVDSNYRFVYVDVGANGRSCDAGIFANSSLYQALNSNSLKIPGPKPLPGRCLDTPYVIVGDDAFPLKDNIMKPYPHRDLVMERKVFNYRLSRARRVSENAFGILTNRFGVFQRSLSLTPETCTKVVLACIALHNFLCTTKDKKYTETEVFPLDNGSRPQSLLQQGGNRSADNARQIREEFADYFCSNGQVDWQWDHIV